MGFKTTKMKSNTEIRESETNGKGVYATTDIKKGEIVVRRNGVKVPSVLVRLLPKYIKERSFPVSYRIHMLPSKPAMYVNHSCDPNCGVINNTDLVAMRDIHKAEEITYDYSTISVENWHMTCNCKSENCRGEIKDYKYLPPHLKEKYSNYVPDWVKERYN